MLKVGRVYVECLANGDLPYSTENSTQCSAIIYVGKESEKERVCVCVYMNPFAVHLNLIPHCQSTLLQ